MNIENISINKKISLWLFLCAFLVIIMILIGGLTRLTNSGLSIVEWKPITGIIPPISYDDWMIEFNKYKQFPEYNLVNKDIKLNDFKFIYILEYIHRLFGRIIGIVFLFPLLYFMLKEQINRNLIFKLLLILILGAMQAFIGWYMVKSGLVKNGNVSQYRLTLHLISALTIYSLILWNAIILYRNKEFHYIPKRSINKYVYLLYGVTFLQLIFGGLVAGTDAGLIYNEFPFMGKGIVPSDLFSITPKYLNFFENQATIQFTHRMLGMSLFILIGVIYFKANKSNLSEEIKKSIIYIIFILIAQISLGILTLIYHVHIYIAIAHQFGAIMLISSLIYLNFRLSFE